MKNLITAAIIAMAAAPALADETSTDKCHWLGMTAAAIAEKRDKGVPLTDMLEIAYGLKAGTTELVVGVYKYSGSTPSEFYTLIKDACELELEEQSK